MVIIRPVQLKDLEALLRLSLQTSFGLTTLPHDKELLKQRIRDSLHAFTKLDAKLDGKLDGKGQGEAFLFVMEDLTTHKVLGTTGIVSKVGGFEPFYAYRLEKEMHVSETLQSRKEIPYLQLISEHNGPSEIGSLFLSPNYRGGGNGRLLSLCRFIFMAEYRKFFDATVLAEMRGTIDDKGHAPFWDGLGRHFFGIDFPKADYLSMKDKRIIAELMPRHPIYIPLLTKAAQAVIGKVHTHSAPALKLLEGEGFARNGMIDIFEAGPIVSCVVEDIRTVRDSQVTTVAKISIRKFDSDFYLIAQFNPNFRVCAAPLAIIPGKGVEISSQTAKALKVKVGSVLRIAPLYSCSNSSSHTSSSKKKSRGK